MKSFTDRTQGALELAKELEVYKKEKPLILALPRGGIPMGKIIAQKLETVYKGIMH